MTVWIRVLGVKSGRLINFIVLPLGSAMVIDPMDLMCNHHLTPTRGGMETVNRNLNGASFSKEQFTGGGQTPEMVSCRVSQEVCNRSQDAFSTLHISRVHFHR